MTWAKSVTLGEFFLGEGRGVALVFHSRIVDDAQRIHFSNTSNALSKNSFEFSSKKGQEF